MPKLLLLRHFKSQWNLENRFTGWVDVCLANDTNGEISAVTARLSALTLHAVYTSPLMRNTITVVELFKHRRDYPIFRHFEGKMRTWGHFFEQRTGSYVPVYVTEALNERFYGKLQGLNKEETMRKYGKERVQLWRRSYTIAPPGGESLKDVVKRVLPFYKKYIEKDLKNDKNVLVVASHNSLRALIKYIERVSDDDIIHVEVPYGGMLEYEFIQGDYKKRNF